MKKSNINTEVIFHKPEIEHKWLSGTKLKAVIAVLMKTEKVKKPFTVIFTGDRFIKELNKRYRYKNEATDVLSFEYDKDSELLGEIIISLQTVKKQSLKYGNSFQKEAFILLIHGFYHILGYKHYKKTDYRKMKKKEESALNILISKRII